MDTQAVAGSRGLGREALVDLAMRRALAQTAAPKSTRSLASTTVSRVTAGPWYLVTYLLAVPVVVVAASSTGIEQLLSGLLAVVWLVLRPIGLYARWGALLLPITTAVFLIFGVVLLTFPTGAYVVDVAAAAVMTLVAFPPGTVG